MTKSPKTPTATTIPASTLAAALKAASAIVETRKTIPILSMVRLQASTDSLIVTTTNLDIEYRQTLEATGPSWSACVDAKRLAAMAGAASGDLSLSLDGNILTVKAGRSRWAAPALPVDDFPEMPVEKLCAPLSVKGLPNILRRTVWAASTEQTTFYLGGVYLDNEDGKLRVLATDRYRFASIETQSKWPKDAPGVIVPTALVNAIKDAGDGSIAWDDRKLRFSSGAITITGKLIEGKFPNYRRVFPDPVEPYAVDADEFLAGVRRVRIASDAQQRKLRIKRGDGFIRLRIEGTASFEGEDEIQADCSDGFEAGINADYLIGMLTALEADSVAIEQAEPGSVFCFRPVAQSGDCRFSGLIFPLRI